MTQFQPKILFLQEIWVSYHAEASLNSIMQDYSIQISTPDQYIPVEDKLSNNDHTWHGAAVLWHDSLNSHIINLKNTHERFTAIKLNLSGQPVLAVSAYLPTAGKDDEFLECIAELSNFIHENTARNVTVLIGTDCNCSEKSSSRRSASFQLFCNQHDLVQISCREPTFHHSNGLSSSNIDCFLISRKGTTNITNIFLQCNQDNPQNLSCHDPVLGGLTVQGGVRDSMVEKYSHTYTDFSYQKIIWNKNGLEDYQKVAGNILTELEAYFPTPEFIPLKCQLYSDILVKAAETTLEKKSKNPPYKQRFPRQLHQAWQHLRKCFNIWKSKGKPRDPPDKLYVEYRLARSRFQYIRRYCNNLKMIKTNNLLMHTCKFDRSGHLKLIKNLRGCKASQKLSELRTPGGIYYGNDTLEGFAKDAEMLGEHVGECDEFENDFYRLCIEDNQFIFEFKNKNDIKIPEMSLDDLEKIINTEMKVNKACDIYKLTSEHLKHCGTAAKHVILRLINDIINNIYYLSCPQIKAGLGIAAYKGKKKPVAESSSYRRITVTPQVGSILDRYIEPLAENVFRPFQSPDQYGFTKNITYLMGAVLRGECQRWALDKKLTCFGVSFDGKAAFPSVDRSIQLRELYSCGESGDLLQYSRYTYENTACKIKHNGKLSREIKEFKGARQGHKRAAGNFKTYINPCLKAADNSQLGFYIGPICISVICIADDTYALASNPRKLQGLIDIIGHYGKRYRLIFGSDKTKVTITGSKLDMKYYEDTSFWSLYGEKLDVTADNEHLGLIVSGVDEEIKNVDKNVTAARNSIFGFLGNIFSYQCKVSPQVQYRTWSVFVKPVLRSGLSALPIRPSAMKILSTFHNKILRAILKLSKYSPIIPLYFLLGEAPIEASVHIDVLSVFYNIWANSNTKVFEVVKYLLAMSDKNSLTWSAHVRTLFQLYKLPDPLLLLDQTPWPKEHWKSVTNTAVISHHEKVLRTKALQNLKLKYLNVQATGLSGRQHPILSWILTTQDVVMVRPHLKMLAGDYQCYANLAADRGSDPSCRLCQSLSLPAAPAEDMVHVLTRCRATADTRSKYLPEVLNSVSLYFPNSKLLCNATHDVLTQFILDCSSLNLPSDIRIPNNHPGFTQITRQCSLMIYGIHRTRTKQLKVLGLLRP